MGIFNRNKYSPPRPIYLENKSVPIPDVPNEPPARSDAPVEDGKMWVFCPNCSEHIFWEVHENAQKVCTKCGYNFRLGAKERIEITADEGSFEEFNRGMIGANPLNFPDYEKKQQGLREKTGENEAIVTGLCTIGGNKCVLAVMDSRYMMGSMGVALGEKFTLAAEKAIELNIPLVAFTASGGARMQEGLFSLMQMAKTSAVCAKMDEKGILYLTVITDPTTGGVTASFASLGDIILSEPDALIGFAGKRVIQQTTGETLPPGFQTAKFMQDSGFIDSIVKRKDLKNEIAKILRLHGGNAK